MSSFSDTESTSSSETVSSGSFTVSTGDFETSNSSSSDDSDNSIELIRLRLEVETYLVWQKPNGKRRKNFEFMWDSCYNNPKTLYAITKTNILSQNELENPKTKN